MNLSFQEAAHSDAANDPEIENENILTEKLQRALDGEHHEFLQDSRRFISNFNGVPHGMSREDHRELTKDRVVAMAQAGFTHMAFPSEYGGKDEADKYLKFVELLSHGDLSTVIKQGVNYGLFGTGVLNLGTQKHHEAYLDDIMNARLLGGFAMTELGGGSNVQGLQTTAVYDKETDSFTINTPDDNAKKAYIGNAALHGEMMIVFAQLQMSEGEESQGVHAFLVPVRDHDTKQILPGIEIEDHGEKVGLNGVDNGRIRFTNVQVPRDSMLDRFAQIDDNGVYHSEIESKTGRFFKMIGTLVTGRVFLSLSSLSAVKNVLSQNITAANKREVFGSNLLDLQASQHALFPALSESYALHFTTRELIKQAQQGTSRELETFAAAMKSRATDFAFKVIDEGRLKAGGEGYMAEYNYGSMRDDIDIYRTFEGDNTVLRLLVARNLLNNVKEKFKGKSKLEQMGMGLSMKFNRMAGRFSLDKRKTSEHALRDPDLHLRLLKRREDFMTFDLSQAVMSDYKKTGDARSAFDQHQMEALALSDAHSDRLMVENFQAAIDRQSDPAVKASLQMLCDHFTVHNLLENATWYLENDILSRAQIRTLRGLEEKLNEQIRPNATTFVDAFAVPEGLRPELPQSNLKADELRP